MKCLILLLLLISMTAFSYDIIITPSIEQDACGGVMFTNHGHEMLRDTYVQADVNVSIGYEFGGVDQDSDTNLTTMFQQN